MPQHRQPRRHRQRIARERPRLVDRAGRRDLAHDVRAPAVGAHRQSAADHLAERGQVRPDAVALLRAAERHAEAGHHFVENQQRAVPRGDLAQRFQVAGRGRHAAHVARPPARRSPPRSRSPCARNACFHARPRELKGSAIVVSAKRLRHALRVGDPQRRHARAGLHQQRIDVAVIAAFELDDQVAAGESARHADARTWWLRCRS